MSRPSLASRHRTSQRSSRSYSTFGTRVDAVPLPRFWSSSSRSRYWAGDDDEGDGEYNEDEEEPDEYTNLIEVVGPPPQENPGDESTYQHAHIEDLRHRKRRSESEVSKSEKIKEKVKTKSRSFLSHLYITSHLILFAILGTLARLGLTALTLYPGAPLLVTKIWANVAGCLIMGYLSEDRFLFRREWFSAQEKAGVKDNSGENSQVEEVKKELGAIKKTVPLFIGLSVGFCGSITSFSSLARDMFLAIDRGLETIPAANEGVEASVYFAHNAGFSLMSLLAVALLTVSLCTSALHVGADLAIGMYPFINKIPSIHLRGLMDPLVVVLAWTAWLGAIIAVIWPPDRPGGPLAKGPTWVTETLRGEVLFALVFAPIGCIIRFHASLQLNGKVPAFPLGTFAVNVLGSIICGVMWDLQRAPLAAGLVGGGQLGCQALQGIQDGFCGCLTTVSSWILELKGLRRRNTYLYGIASIVVTLAFMIVIMGSMVWTVGEAPMVCTVIG